MILRHTIFKSTGVKIKIVIGLYGKDLDLQIQLSCLRNN